MEDPMKTRQIAHNDYPAAKYRSRALDIQRALLYGRRAGALSAVHKWFHGINDGTDNDDVDGYASEINRGVRTRALNLFFPENPIFTRATAPTNLRYVTRDSAACNSEGNWFAFSVGLNSTTTHHGRRAPSLAYAKRTLESARAPPYTRRDSLTIHLLLCAGSI